MKKIVFAVDGTNFSNGAFEFVRMINEKNPVLVTGLFVPQTDFADLWSYSAAIGSHGVFVPLLEDEENAEMAKNISRFEHRCHENKIAYRVHKDFFDIALPELKRESRFADVMVLSGELFYKHVVGADRFDYLRSALHNSECPVVIVPESIQLPKSNILAYDGTEDSVYAIKQFAYVFPELAANKTMLVYANEEKEKDIPSKDLILELVKQHFPDLSVYKLNVNPRTFFESWLDEQDGSILVSGSFGRSAFSEAIKRSFVMDIIRKHHVPVFIAHK